MTDRETMKLALEALEEAQAYTSCESFSPSMTNELAICAARLRQALAQQKLSDSIRPKGKSITKVWVDEINQALEQPEPAAWKHDCSALLTNDVELWIDRCPHCGKPRTAPPKREWVGLTDEEVAEGAKQSWVDKQAFESAVWWAEEKLREKNGF